MGMIDVVREVKAGKRKLEDVDPGIRRQVARLLPVVGEGPARKEPTNVDRMSRGPMTHKVRMA